MAAHITYLSEASLTEKFGRRLQNRDEKTFGFDADFQVESYLRHQGASFKDRFDANSYLYLTRAMSYFDLAEEQGGRLADAFTGTKARFCVVSFDSDWLYPTELSRTLAHALNAAGAPVSFVELSAPFGHDRFLLDVPALDRVVAGFLERGRAILRPDLALIAAHVAPGTRVLDVGCGDGALLEALRAKGCDARGMEIDPANVAACVAKGLSVIQGDADADLAFYPDRRFDYAILVGNAADDDAARQGAGRTAADRPARRGQLSQFRPLAGADVAADGRTHAGDAAAAGRLVRNAQHPPPDHRRFPRSGGGARHHGGAGLVPLGRHADRRHGLANLRAEHAIYLLTR